MLLRANVLAKGHSGISAEGLKVLLNALNADCLPYIPEQGTVGASGDLVLWDGDPLELASAPTMVLIGGEVQSLESRQTRLRDRYLDLDESEMPLAN